MFIKMSHEFYKGKKHWTKQALIRMLERGLPDPLFVVVMDLLCSTAQDCIAAHAGKATGWD